LLVPRLARPLAGGLAIVLLGVAIGLSACGKSSSARQPSSSVGAVAIGGCPSPAAARRARSTLRNAKLRYRVESRGAVIHADLRYIAHDRTLLNALRDGNLAAARAEVHRLQHSQIVKHVTRIRVLQGQRVLIDGWPTSFDVAGSERELPGRQGYSLGRLQITIQDIIGFIKLERRREAAEVLVRGAGGQVRTLLPAAKTVPLPRFGCAQIGGLRYVVSSFQEMGFTGVPLTIWLLTAAADLPPLGRER
jgi:hypothetical protein